MGEKTMKKGIIGVSILLLATCCMTQTGFSQVQGERVVSLSGFIVTVSKDLKYIGLNEMKVFLSDTKIANDTGAVLKVSDLKPRLYVTVEGTQNSNGIFAKRITVIGTPKLPRSRLRKP